MALTGPLLSRKNSLELIELSTINRVSLVMFLRVVALDQ